MDKLNKLTDSIDIKKREWLLLTSACLIKLIAGQSFSGSVYANFMKYSYGLNQRQLEFSIVSISMGNMLILLCGLFYDRYGSRASVAFSGLLSTMSIAFLILAMAYPQQMQMRVWLLYILLFLYGHSFSYSYVAAIGCCMGSFQPSRRGLTMTLLDNSFSLGPPVVAFIYYVVFDNMNRSVTDQRPVRTLIVLLAFSLFVHLLAFVFLTPLESSRFVDSRSELKPILREKNQQQQQPETVAVSTDDDDKTASKGAKNIGTVQHSTPQHIPEDDLPTQMQDFLTTCCSTRFLYLLLGIALSIGTYSTIFLNLTSVTRSLSLTQYDVYYFWFPTLAGIVWRCLVGPLTDRYLSKASQRSFVLLAFNASFGAASVLMLSTPLAPGASPVGVTMAADILAMSAVATTYLLLPVIISQTEQRHMFGRLYSVCLLLGSVVTLPLMLQFGALYDSHAQWRLGAAATNSSTALTPPEAECFGQSCYIYGCIAPAVCQFLSIAFLAYYTISLLLASS